MSCQPVQLPQGKGTQIHPLGKLHAENRFFQIPFQTDRIPFPVLPLLYEVLDSPVIQDRAEMADGRKVKSLLFCLLIQLFQFDRRGPAGNPVQQEFFQFPEPAQQDLRFILRFRIQKIGGQILLILQM